MNETKDLTLVREIAWKKYYTPMHCIMYSNVESSQALDNAGGDADDLTATTASEVESGTMTILYK